MAAGPRKCVNVDFKYHLAHVLQINEAYLLGHFLVFW